MPDPTREHSHTRFHESDNRHLRSLAHDLSNAIETILQAAYLLGQSGLEGSSQEWVKMIDSASQDAAQINRQIREILKSQS